jgi:hypothetical protein
MIWRGRLRKKDRLEAQIAIEYLIVAGAIIAAIIASNFIGRIRGSCETYFERAAQKMK